MQRSKIEKNWKEFKKKKKTYCWGMCRRSGLCLSGCEKNTWWCWGQWLGWCPSVPLSLCVWEWGFLFFLIERTFFFFFLLSWPFVLLSFPFSFIFWHCFYPWWFGLSGSGQKEEYFSHSCSCGFGIDDSCQR